MARDREAQKLIYKALNQGDLEKFNQLLKRHPDNLRYEDGRECWLYEASGEGRLPFVKVLVDEFGIGVDESNSPDTYFPETALDAAATKGHLEVVRWLLDHGATLNFEVDGDVGCPSLRSAAAMGKLDVAKLLVERGAYLHHVLHDMNPISLADCYGHLEVAKYLRSVGAKHMCEITPPDYPTGHRLILESLTEERGPLGDWSVEIPGDPSVTIHTIPANNTWKTRTLFTLGLSDKNLPWETHTLYMHRELRMLLPADWPFAEAALSDPQYNWPVEWLKRLVPQLLADEFWPPKPVLFMNGDPLKPLAPGTQQSGWLCLRSNPEEAVELPDHRCVEWHDLFPVYPEEAELVKQRNDTDDLVHRFNERNVPLFVDPTRENVSL